MTAAVTCKGVKKTFGTGTAAVQALRGIDLEIAKGELFMLMGPSGSGKTTLISVIAGILTQDEGDCIISEVHLNHLSDHEKTVYRGKHIGFVFQAFNLIPSLTLQENVSIPLILNGTIRKEAEAKAASLLEQVGLQDRIKAYPNQLSGGQMQRVAIARSLVHNPDLIVCDEPTSQLDHTTGGKIMELLQSIIHTDSKTLIVVTHDNRITSFADRIAKMDDGRIV